MSSLRDMRKAKRLTQREIADALGVSVAYISDVEAGRRAPLPYSRLDPRALVPIGFTEDEVRQLQQERSRADGVGFVLMRGISLAHDQLGDELMEAWVKLTRDQCRGLSKMLTSIGANNEEAM